MRGFDGIGMPGRPPIERSRGRHPRGASLIEILVATLILSIVALGMAEFFAKGRMGFDQEERKRVATLLAQEAMERTTARPYAEIAPWAEQRTVAHVRYAINVTNQTDVPEASIKTVRSTVTWQATPSAQRSVSLATLVYDQ